MSSRTASEPAVRLEATSLERRFSGRVIFYGLGLTVLGGQSLLISGPNGSGKSTLIRVLAGVLRPSSGSVVLQIGDRQIPREERPLHCGLVAPYMSLYLGLTARENLEFIAEARQLPDAAPAIQDALDKVDLAPFADAQVSTFSSGMVQRLKLATVHICRPDVLLLDEPWTNLDESGRALVSAIISEQQERDRPVVIASNDPVLKSQSYDHRLDITDFKPVSQPRQIAR